MPGRLENKIAIITGASSGIGRAIALAYAAEGASLICSDIREDARVPTGTTSSSSLTTVQEVEKLGGKAIYVHCDTSSEADIQALIQKAVVTYGRLDIMVNNAGISPETEAGGGAPIWAYDTTSFDRVMSINTKGVFLGIKYAAAQMVSQEPGPSGDRGWIINLCSVFGLGGAQRIAGYAASKHAVLGLTKVAALDCAEARVHVNALCPGFVETAIVDMILKPENEAARKRIEMLHPFKGLGSVRDVARAAVFLASEDASWVTGVGLPVDGGYSAK